MAMRKGVVSGEDRAMALAGQGLWSRPRHMAVSGGKTVLWTVKQSRSHRGVRNW